MRDVRVYITLYCVDAVSSVKDEQENNATREQSIQQHTGRR